MRKKLKMVAHKMPGILITFCGLDGCGKTTMLNKLAAELGKEYEVCITKQPTDKVRRSEIFRTYMDSPDNSGFDYRSLSLLAASDRLQHVNKEIAPLLENGKIVLSDRYFYSCLANLRARGFSSDSWIYDVSKFIIKPDIAFFFDVPVDKAVARVRSRAAEKDRYIDMELQKELYKQYREICKKNCGVLISTELSEEESYKIVKETVERKLKNGQRK